jgi:hypothetical protein
MAIDTQTKTDLAEQLRAVCLELSLLLEQADEKVLFERLPGKWNGAQQTDHLTIANTVTALGFAMPRPVLKALFGTSNRISHSYDEIVFRYQSKLSGGAKASFAFQPRLSLIPNKKLVTGLWNRSVDGLIGALASWDEADLDTYLLAHPILGKVTMREMLYFTIYHVRHHRLNLEAQLK